MTIKATVLCGGNCDDCFLRLSNIHIGVLKDHSVRLLFPHLVRLSGPVPKRDGCTLKEKKNMLLSQETLNGIQIIG